jgi:phosphoglycolate phosphatase
MASAAGCVSVWAKYGTDVDPGDWERLVRITHWTDETVAQDEALRRVAAGIQPDYVIERFAELLELAARETSAQGLGGI